MSAQRHQNNQDILKKFIPLNTLSAAHFANICNECHIEECAKGTILFEQGDDAKEFIYLISGMISLYAGEMEMETIVTGSEVARFAIAHHLPRKIKAVTKSKARIVRIPTHMLDMDSPEDNGQTYLVDEVEDQGGDWMTTMLQSPVFQRLPASNLQKVMMQMEEVAFGPGDVVVKQGDEADFYYIIKSGDCELIRQPSEEARSIKLGELHSCDAFGEDALLSGNPRNVTVQMKGRGQMLRLSKANFIKLVKEPVLQYVDFEEGQKKVDAGANWLDVRSADEHADGHIENSINIPFFSLRMKIPELRHDQLQVLVCANGRTSEAAAFLLLKFGFNALILKGGIARCEKSRSGSKTPVTASAGLPPETVVTNVSELSNTAVSANDGLDSKQLEEAQSKIMALEKLCAQSNEKFNTLELERDDLQQQNEQQSTLVAELQRSSKLVTDELAAINTSNESRDAEMGEVLSVEKKKSAVLSAELEDKKSALNKAMHEANSSRESFILLDKDVAVKDKELEALKLALSSAEKREEEITKGLNQEIGLVKQEVAELAGYNEALENKAEVSRHEIDELSQSKVQLEQQIEQSKQNSNRGILEKEEQVQLLNSQLSEASSSLTESKQSQAELKTRLSEMTSELEQVQESEKAAIEKNKLDSTARQDAFDSELSVLTLQLEKKAAELEQHEERVTSLNSELEYLKEKNQNSDTALSKKEADIDEFSNQLDEEKNKLAALSQKRLDLESALLEKDALLTETTEKLTSVEAESENLKQNLEQSGDDLSALSVEQSTLKKQLNESLQLVDELKENESAFLTNVDDLEQQKEKAEKALEASVEALAESSDQVEKLERESKDLYQQVKNAETTLSELNSGKETLASELTQRLVDAEANYRATLADQQEIQQQLETEINDKKHIQQKLEGLNHQLESGQGEQQQLNQRLAEVQEELNEVRQKSETKVAQLTESLQQAEAGFKEMDAASSKLFEEKERSDKQYQQKIDEFEGELSSIKESKVEIERGLASAVLEKEAAEQELLEAQSELESSLGEQQKLTEEFSQVRRKADEVAQEKDTERLQLAGSLEQAQAQLKTSEASLVEQAKQADARREQQTKKLEIELKTIREKQLFSDEQLESAQSDNEALQQKVLDAEKVLSASTGDQKALLAELDQARNESLKFKKSVDSKQLEIDATLSAKVELEEELVESKKSIKESSSLLETSEQRCADLMSTVEALSSEQKTEGSLFEEQLKALENKLQQAENDRRSQADHLQTAEISLTSVLGEKEELFVELKGLKQAKVSGDDAAKTSEQKIVELEQSLKQLKEQKQQFIANADKGSDEKAAQLTEQLLAAQNETDIALKKVDEIVASRDAGVKENGELEEKLELTNAKNRDLKCQIADVQRQASKDAGGESSEQRIKELEKQLDDASSMLLDLEIKLESSAIDEGSEPTEDGKNELKALQSELSLVREQTEKDIQAMQAKVENSEKMNIALKKKILSMQALANQEVLPEEPPKEKKKGWWK